MASPHMSRPFRFIGDGSCGSGPWPASPSASRSRSGWSPASWSGSPPAAIVHLIFGSPRDASRSTRSPPRSPTSASRRPISGTRRWSPRRGAALADDPPDGRSLLVKVYGRDAWDGQLLTSLWSSLWRRGERPTRVRPAPAGRARGVRHVARRAGGRAGPARRGRGHGDRARRPAGDRDHRTTARVARPGRRSTTSSCRRSGGPPLELHELGIAHGQLDGDRFVVRPDGSPAFGDFGGAKVAATDGALMADRAQLLVTTALVVGPDRAIAAATAALGNDAFASLLPFLQPAVLDRETRRAVRERDWDMDDLMKAPPMRPAWSRPSSSSSAGSPASIAIVALIAFLAYALISALAGSRDPEPLRRARSPRTWRGCSRPCSSRRSPRSPRRSRRSAPRSAPVLFVPVADAPIRGPVHRARGAELRGEGRPGGPLLPAPGRRRRRRALDRPDRQRVRVRDPDRC